MPTGTPFPSKNAQFWAPSAASPSTLAAILDLSNIQQQIAHSDEDVSTKGDGGHRARYPEGAQTDVTINADFVATDDPDFDAFRDVAESPSAPRVVGGELRDGARVYAGDWQVLSISFNAPAAGAITGSIALAQVGAITITDAP